MSKVKAAVLSMKRRGARYYAAEVARWRYLMPDETPIPCASVEFIQHRWRTRIVLRDTEGAVIETYVACSDRGVTYGDGTWFGTELEYEEAMQDA